MNPTLFLYRDGRAERRSLAEPRPPIVVIPELPPSLPAISSPSEIPDLPVIIRRTFRLALFQMCSGALCKFYREV